MKRILLFTLLPVLLVVLYACEDDLVELDPNRVVPENFFGSAGEVEAAVLSGYTTLRSNRLVGRFWYFMHDVRDDAHTGTSALFGDAQQIDNGNPDPSMAFVDDIWSNLYVIIHRQNTALDGIIDNTDVPADQLAPLEGEARFLRAWAYGELATLYGGVPLHTTAVKTSEDELPRASLDEVWSLVESDLAFAADNLPDTRTENNLGRATSWTAKAFLARFHMQQNDLAAARPVLVDIIDNGPYSLVENYGMLFTEENNFLSETIWEVVYEEQGGYNWNPSGDGTNLRSARAQEYGPTWRNVSPTTKFIDAFENEEDGDNATDPRLFENVIFDNTIYNDGNDTLIISRNGPSVQYLGEETWANWYKYENYYKRTAEGFILTGHNMLMFRLADAMLLLAEIEAREGNLEEARRLVNIIRDRAGAVPIEESSIPNGTQQEMIYAVQHERTVELASEQVRDRDLQRYKAANLLAPADQDVALFNANENGYLPIPQAEIQNNPMVTGGDQNPGY